MIDDWQHAAPLGPIGRVVDLLILRRHMAGSLRARNTALAREAASVANRESPPEL